MSSPQLDYRAWVNKAEHDLLNVENNLKAAQVPWDTVCFHCQQAAEKLLKAILVRDGEVPQRTHDLILVLAHCVRRHPELADLEQDCRLLNTHGASARYPGQGYEPTEQETRASCAGHAAHP